MDMCVVTAVFIVASYWTQPTYLPTVEWINSGIFTQWNSVKRINGLMIHALA